jgi:hypothetical protein
VITARLTTAENSGAAAEAQSARGSFERMLWKKLKPSQNHSLSLDAVGPRIQTAQYLCATAD